MKKDEFDRLLPLKVPHVVASCPICGDCIFIEEINDWVEDDGNMAIDEQTSVSVDCATAPDIDDEGWEDWFNGHWSTPYIDWLPVGEKVGAWLAKELKQPNMLKLLCISDGERKA